MAAIEYKKIVAALICVVLCAACLIAGIYIHVFFCLSAAFMGAYVCIDRKYLRCPHCGGFTNLDRLLLASRREYRCAQCGNPLRIKR